MVEQNELRTMNKESGKRIKKSNKKLKDCFVEICNDCNGSGHNIDDSDCSGCNGKGTI